MRYLVNDQSVELNETVGVEVIHTPSGLIVRTPEGTFSALAVRKGDTTWISYKGKQFKVEKPKIGGVGQDATASGTKKAPLPGQVVDVFVTVGQKVKEGERLLIMEAMKMQQSIVAAFDGQVTSLNVAVGDKVSEGDTLVVIEPTE